MYNVEQMKERLEKMLLPSRFKHSVRVKEEAEKLAVKYGVDVQKAGIAGLLHDCARDLSYSELLNKTAESGIILDNVAVNSPKIIHAIVGPVVAGEVFNISDAEILDAIRYHTTGRTGMTVLDKIIFISDLTEPERNFQGVETVRELAEQDLDGAVLFALDHTIMYLIEKRQLIHEDTLKARNYYYLTEVRNGVSQ